MGQPGVNGRKWGAMIKKTDTQRLIEGPASGRGTRKEWAQAWGVGLATASAILGGMQDAGLVRWDEDARIWEVCRG